MVTKSGSLSGDNCEFNDIDLNSVCRDKDSGILPEDENDDGDDPIYSVDTIVGSS